MKEKITASRIKEDNIARFVPQRRNANRHSQRGLGSLEASMRKHGYVAPMTAAADGEIIDGSARLETVANVFDDDVLVVEHDGTKPVIMVRTDIKSADTPEARAISIAANRVAELNLAWDAQILLEDLASGVDFSGIFDQEELDAMLAGISGGTAEAPNMEPDENRYKEQYGVIVMCRSEAHQEEVYNTLQAEGYNVKVVVT